MINSRFIAIAGMIVVTAVSRVIPHPPNFTPVAAIALFGGAYVSKKWLAFVVPLASLFLSDLVLGLYSRMYVVYGAFALVVCIGLLLRRRRKPMAIAGAALASSVLFFLISNFGVWFYGSLYPKTMEGLIACYAAGIPFFRNTLLGDALYTLALFGGFALLENLWPALREQNDRQLRSA